jgi:hypothetical protein
MQNILLILYIKMNRKFVLNYAFYQIFLKKHLIFYVFHLYYLSKFYLNINFIKLKIKYFQHLQH